MQPEAQRLLEIAQNVDSALNTNSQNDATFRALLHELKHQESVEQFCREQMSGMPELVTEMSGRFETQTRELDEMRARNAALEAENAALKAAADEPAVRALDDITGHKRPPLHAVETLA